MGNATIIQRTIGTAFNSISLPNCGFARAVNIPVGWQHIRMGMRYQMTNNGLAGYTGPMLAYGFCSGLTNQVGDATTTHFVGITVGTLADTTPWYIYGGSPPYMFQVNDSSAKASVKIGSTWTQSAGALWTGNFYHDASASDNLAEYDTVAVDLVYGSPNYTVSLPWVHYYAYVHNCPSDYFLAMMSQPSPTIPDIGYSVASASGSYPQAIAVNEALNGTLNAITVYFYNPFFNIEITDLAFSVLA